MTHLKEECPLHNLGLGELYSTARRLGFDFPREIQSNKKMMVSILHDYIETYQPLSRAKKVSK